MTTVLHAQLAARHLVFNFADNNNCTRSRGRCQLQPLAAVANQGEVHSDNAFAYCCPGSWIQTCLKHLSAVEANHSIFQDLQQQADVEGCFEVRQSRHGQGVFVTRDVAKGEVGCTLHQRSSFASCALVNRLHDTACVTPGGHEGASGCMHHSGLRVRAHHPKPALAPAAQGAAAEGRPPLGHPAGTALLPCIPGTCPMPCMLPD